MTKAGTGSDMVQHVSPKWTAIEVIGHTSEEPTAS
jgi:hypothetical protein